jgi:hypothetical protein
MVMDDAWNPGHSTRKDDKVAGKWTTERAIQKDSSAAGIHGADLKLSSTRVESRKYGLNESRVDIRRKQSATIEFRSVGASSIHDIRPSVHRFQVSPLVLDV